MDVLNRVGLAGALLLGVVLSVVAAESPESAQSKPNVKSEAQEGEKLFQTQCGRCHNAPDELSPKSVRAVVMHMRVRAILSEREERVLLQYIAPGEKTP